MHSDGRPIFKWTHSSNRTVFELALAILFLVRANEVCETTRNDFDLLRS
jgi:hypothetical protein